MHTKSHGMLSFEAGDMLARWGEQLKQARLARNETQATMAQRMGVSLQTLGRLENGDSTVSMAIFLNALDALGMLGDLAKAFRNAREDAMDRAPRERQRARPHATRLHVAQAL